MTEHSYTLSTVEAFQASRSNTILELLNVQFVAVDEAHLVLRMPITNAARQPFGLLHGGVSMVLAETAASSHAAWGIDLTKVVPVGIEINGSHLSSAREGYVRVVATPVRRSRVLVVHQVEVSHEESGRLLCVARVTNYYKTVGN